MTNEKTKPDLDPDMALQLAANKYADSDSPFMGQQRTFQAFLAGAAWTEQKYKSIMSCCDWDGKIWKMRV